MKKELVLQQDFDARALSFPSAVKSVLSTLDTPMKAAKVLRGGDAMLQLAKDLGATKQVIDAIQQGRLYTIARIGELMPAARPHDRGQGRKGKKSSKPPLLDLPLSKPTLASFRKVSKYQKKIDDYMEAKRGDADTASMNGFICWVGAGSVVATRHGNDIIEWYTPAKYIELIRKAMGAIDLDPATSLTAQKTVKAKRYFTADDDGLAREWQGCVFLNPPFKQPAGKKFVNKLCDGVEGKSIEQAVLLTNDQTDTHWWQRAAGLAGCVCFHSGRISFYNEAGETSCPTNGQTFFYFGRRQQAFSKTFTEIGTILCCR